MTARDDRSGPGAAEAPLTVELIADYHAGMLNDVDAAVVRRRIAEDDGATRALAALDRVQNQLAGLQDAPADEPPPEVIADVTGALRAQSTDSSEHFVTGTRTVAAHADRPSRLPSTRLRLIGLMVGLGAVLVAVGVGTTALLSPASSTEIDSGTTAKYITVDPPAPEMPLSDAEILALLDSEPDFGPLVDRQRLVSCLDGLGYGADTDVLGARAVEARGADAVVLVVAADTPDEVVALLVPASCSAVDTGLIADAVVAVP